MGMTSLINLKKAEHENRKLFTHCFSYCLAIRTSKVHLPLHPGKTKTGYKYELLIRAKES